MDQEEANGKTPDQQRHDTRSPTNSIDLELDISLLRALPALCGIAAAHTAGHAESSEGCTMCSVVVRRRADVGERDGEDDQAVPRRQHDEREEELEEDLRDRGEGGGCMSGGMRSGCAVVRRVPRGGGQQNKCAGREARPLARARAP